MIPLPSSTPPFSAPSNGSGSVGADGDEIPKRDERFPQWSIQETRDFIEIRAQLEWGFNVVKRNKNLWETVVNRMKEKGHNRTIDQCKGKWKNLVSRYKGIQVSNVDNAQQCPFFDELHSVFMNRVNSMVQQAQVESVTVKGKNKRKICLENQSQEDLSGGQDDDETEIEIDLDPRRKMNREKRRKVVKQPVNTNNKGIVSLVEDMMRNFTQQQQWIDLQWREAMEKNDQERKAIEKEWKRTMEKLEMERLAMDQAWNEREQQRRVKEETRAEKRDALLTILMNKLIRDDNAST